MGAHFRWVKAGALCVFLLAVASALAGCGNAVCQSQAPPQNAALTVANGVVYGAGFGVGARRSAMRASDGKALWQKSEVGPGNHRYIPVAPVVDGQTVIYTIQAGQIAAARATDGAILWSSQPLAELWGPGGALVPPVVVDGVVYAAVSYGAIAAWDERDGRTLWVSHFAPDAEAAARTEPIYRVSPLPVVAGSIVYASAGSSLYALRVSDGSVLWRLTDTPVNPYFSIPAGFSAPVVAANTVYVADISGVMYALDPATGTVRWRSPGPSNTVNPIRPSVVVQGQTVFFASQGSLVRALNAATGAQLWRYQTRTGFSSLAPLVVEDGRVYLAALPLALYVVDAATGRELWSAPLDQDIFNSASSPSYRPFPDLSTPTVDQGKVVLAAAKGVVAWRVSDGHELWLTRIPDTDGYAESAAVVAGVVYVAQKAVGGLCGENGKPPRVLALRDTDGAMRWRVSI